MDYEEKNERFQQLIEEIIRLAEADGKITNSEAKVIKRVQFSIKEFDSAVNKALDDGIITDAESLMLRNVEQNFLQEVFDLIEQDDKLDDDGKKLVEILFDVMMNTLE